MGQGVVCGVCVHALQFKISLLENYLKLGFYTSCSDISQKLPKSCSFHEKVAQKLLFINSKNQFLLLMKVNLCTSIRVIYLFIYSFLLANISIPTEMIFCQKIKKLKN